MPTLLTGLPVSQGGRYLPPVAAGSGATARIDFPDWTQPDNSAAQVTTRGGVRLSCSFTTAGSGSKNQFNVNGVDCCVLQTLLAADVSTLFLDPLTLRHNTQIGHSFSAGNMNWANRVVVNMAANGITVDNAHDFGFQIVSTSALSGSIFGNSLAGWGVTLRGPAAFDLLIRGANGIIQIPYTGIDTTKFHAYEFRFFGATAGANATLAFYVDGIRQPVPLLSSQWGIAGSNLPASANWAAGRLGWQTRLVNACGFGGSGQLFIANASVITAPTEANLY